MPTYGHFQEAKKHQELPDTEKVGVCLTCQYWDVEEHRSEAITARVARCVQPELVAYALLVSGSSACNRWKEKAGVPEEATAYAKRGESK